MSVGPILTGLQNDEGITPDHPIVAIFALPEDWFGDGESKFRKYRHEIQQINADRKELVESTKQLKLRNLGKRAVVFTKLDSYEKSDGKDQPLVGSLRGSILNPAKEYYHDDLLELKKAYKA